MADTIKPVHIPPGMLIRVIQDKKDKIDRYEQLLSMAIAQEEKEIIQEILKEETSQYHIFINLYDDLFGNQINITPTDALLHSYLNGIKSSIIGELNSYSYYFGIFFSDSDPNIHKIFLQAATEENKHAAKFQYIYTNYTKIIEG